MRIALYEPDIPQNTGTILRLSACLGVGGASHRAGRVPDPPTAPSAAPAWTISTRSRIDPPRLVGRVRRLAAAERLRLVLFTTAAERSYLDHAYRRDDVLLFGRESAGVPDEVHEAADARLDIPMREGLRSLNVAMAAAMAAGEMVRQIG